MQARDGLVGDDGGAHARQPRGDLGAGVGQQAAADQDVVGACARDRRRRLPAREGALPLRPSGQTSSTASRLEVVGKGGEDIVDDDVVGDVARLDVDRGLGVDRVALGDQLRR